MRKQPGVRGVMRGVVAQSARGKDANANAHGAACAPLRSVSEWRSAEQQRYVADVHTAIAGAWRKHICYLIRLPCPR